MEHRVQSKNLIMLQKQAQSLSLTFLIDQLVQAGFKHDTIHLYSVESDYSKANIVESLSLVDGKARIKLNLGGYAAQSLCKDINIRLTQEDPRIFKNLINLWLKNVIFMMHPEVDSEYKNLFVTGTKNNSLSPISKAQLYTQLALILPCYDIAVEVTNNICNNLRDFIILGVSRLSNTSSYIGNINQALPEIIITLYCEEPISKSTMATLMEIIRNRWCVNYACYWSGFKMKIFQNYPDGQRLTHLPSTLSKSSFINAKRRLLAEEKL